MTFAFSMAPFLKKSLIKERIIFSQGFNKLAALRSICYICNLRATRGKPFLFLKLNTVPRWVTQDDIKSSTPPCLLIVWLIAIIREVKYLWKSYMPVEELVLLSQT